MIKSVISIIVPVYNEEKIIGKFLESYCDFFEKAEIKDKFEIITVINNTTDSSEKIIKNLCKKYKEIKYINLKEKGKGLAIIKGFEEALKGKSEFVGFVDADLSTSPEAFYDLVRNLKSKNADGIIANRWDKRSKINLKQNTIRRIISRGGNLIIRALFFLPYRDTQCGAKIFRREVLEKITNKLITSNWGFDIALLFCLKKEAKAKVISIPTKWEDRKESKLDVKKIPFLVLASVIRLRLIHSPFKFLVRFYRKLPQRFKMKQ